MNQEQKRYQAFEHELTNKDGTIMHINQALKNAARLWPHKIALISPTEQVTFRDLYARSCRLGIHLIEQGTKPKDLVLLWCPNDTAFYVAYFAILQIGAVVVPINTMLHAHEVAYIIKDSQAVHLITTKEKSDQLQKNNIDTPPITDSKDWNQSSTGLKTSLNITIPKTGPDELTALLYTSGTKGQPKGVMLSSKNILTNVLQGVARLNPTHEERVCAILPLFHSFAQNSCVWTPILFGATVIVCPRIERKSLLWALGHKPTAFLGVPMLYGLMCKMLTLNLNSIRYFIAGGDILTDKIRAAFALIYGRKLINGYGLTETSPVIAIQDGTNMGSLGAVGSPCLGVEVSIRNQDGTPAPDSTVGNIWVKGENIMLGYYKAAQKTDAIIKNGWFNTGDTGRMTTNGKLVLAGRSKDLIINKGLNIYPQEIENVLQSHNNVLLAAVIGQIMEDGQELPIAFVQLANKQEEVEQTLRSLCKERLAPYKIPRSVRVIRKMPLTASGKIDKKVLVDNNIA